VALLRPFEEICMWLHPRSALVALTSGVFDIAHSGHRRFLARCKSLCDTLVVGVDSDDLVRARKGVNRPFQRELERRLMLHRWSGPISFSLSLHLWIIYFHCCGPTSTPFRSNTVSLFADLTPSAA
jgi:cytidyltransferase-like protein